MTAKTTTERVTQLRTRRREAGLKEVRNLWAPPEHHQRIREYARMLLTQTKDEQCLNG